MKINSLEIERFGLWSELNVPKLSGGINVFYGANEAGKSTILEFIRAQLYGFTGERKRFLIKPPAGQAPSMTGDASFVISGGTLQIETPSGQFKLRRMYYPEEHGKEEQAELQTADGEKQGLQLLRVLVAGVDEPTFNNIFAIGLDELQRLASLSDTDAAEMLFRLSVGMERVSIVDAIKELTGHRNKVLNIGGAESKPSQLTLLLQHREKIIEELSDAKLQVRQYVQLRNEQRIVDRSIAHLQDDLAHWDKEKRTYEIARASYPIWLRRDKLQNAVSGMGQVADVSDNIIAQLESATADLAQQRTNYEQVKSAFAKAKSDIAALKINPKIQQLAPRIEILLEEEERLHELEVDVERLNKEIAEYSAKIKVEEAKRGSSVKEPADTKTDTKENLPLYDYRSFAKEVNRANQRLLRTKEQYADLQGRLKTLNEKIKNELVKRDVRDIPEAVAAAGETVSQLKRRQTIGHKAAEMAVYHKELRRVNAFLIQNQALPPWMFGLMIIAGILGAFCIGVGIYPSPLGLDKNLTPAAVIFGSLLIGGSITSKIFSEKSNAKKLEANQRQLGVLTQQLERHKEELAAIDQRYPAVGTATIEIRLQEAMQEAVTLEKLLPVDAQRRQTAQRGKQLDVRLEHCQREQLDALERWQEYLQRAGLPSDWTPARIRDYLAHSDTLGDLKREAEKRVESANGRIQDGNVMTRRIEKTAEEAGIDISGETSYSGLFVKFRQLLAQNSEALRRREEIVKKIRTQLRPMRKQVSGALQRAGQTLRDLLRQFNVKTPDELKSLHRRHKEYRALLQQKQNVQQELDAAIGGFCDESEIEAILLRYEKELLKEKETAGGLPSGVKPEYSVSDAVQTLLENALRNIESLSAKLHEELETRGQLTEQMRQIAEDKSVIRKQRERAILDEKIRQAVREWQVYAVCTRMLDEIRASYERDRQPRTLAEASELLKRLTVGRYQRIWTPLGEETLLLDDADGRTFDVVQLSRGTREQLFITLRLALASEFARHGSILPLILDDVLVNFDSYRALEAAKLLLEVAETGRQILLFTCHEHICRIFQRLDVPVRILPATSDAEKTIRVLLPLSVLKRRRMRRLRQEKRLHREQEEERLRAELAEREESIRLDAVRKAEVQRLVVQMQQQATAEKAVEAERDKRN
ncbi:MAG: AAA family ATPase [Planctomycetaceae bacterium]|jgi:uncharacterized protein YhaN|nr:AAA family ATPase [Planctomycetaceae bacterium]